MITETPEDQETELGSDLIAQLWQPRFPSPELVSEAAGLVPSFRQAAGPDAELAEGPHWEFTVGPGMVSIRSKDYARQERTHERQVKADRAMVDQLVRYLADEGDFPADSAPTREITGWSRKSRAAMVERLCTLDYQPLFPKGRLPSMVTLTYSGAWEVVAPNGKTVKKHLKALRKRWKRAWGEDLVCVWKLEFQHRGAPHFHLLCSPPIEKTAGGEWFRTWLSRSWAEIVAHPDPEEFKKHLGSGTRVDLNEGLRSTDPKRVAVYFTKHGTFAAKEYQYCVPKLWQKPGQGPGRFWGYWGLEVATTTVEITPETQVKAARTIRRWARAQRTTRQVTRMRVEQATGRVRYRNTRTRVKRMGNGGRGFVSVNNGAQFASALARHLTDQDPENPEQRRERLVAATGSIQAPASSDIQPTTR